MRARLPWILTLLLIATPAAAREGIVPVHGAATITEPGHYLVTRDIELTAGAVLTIDAPNVTLDLGGHTLSKPSSSSYVISIGVAASDVIIRNGRLVGGAGGVGHTILVNPLRIVVENLEIEGGDADGIALNAVAYVEVRGCRVTNSGHSGIRILGFSGKEFEGRIVDNTVDSPARNGIELHGLHGGIVRGNVVANHGTVLNGMAGIRIAENGQKLGGNLVAGNTVRNGGPDAHGIIILPETAAGSLVFGNVTTSNGMLGLSLSSSDNHVVDNVSRENGSSGIRLFSVSGVSHNLVAGNEVASNGAPGIEVWGSHNLIDDNLSEGNVSYGITFATFPDSMYRGNMLRDNGSGAVGGTGSGIDSGGNIP